MDSKTRYWSFLLYLDSMNPNYIDFLNDLHIPVAISPLHDKDINPTGEIKKPHYHVIVCFEGPTTYKNVYENICVPLGATIPKRVMSLRGYYRYLCHLDNAEKYQYNTNDITELGDFKIELSDTEINMIKIKIIQDIEKHDLRNYKELCDYYISFGLYDEFNVVSKHVMFFKNYISDYKKAIN